MRSRSNAKKKRQRLRRNIKTKKDSSTSINDKISSVSSDDSLKVGMVVKPSRDAEQKGNNKDNLVCILLRQVVNLIKLYRIY